MANWTGPGFVGQMFKTIAKHIAPSGMPSPVLWGDVPTVRERLRSGIASLECSRHLYEFSYPFLPSDVVEFCRANYGPMTCAFAFIGEEAQQQLRAELTDLWSRHNRANDGTTRVDAEYLQVVAIRGQSEAIANLAHNVRVSRSRFAERFRYFLGEPPMAYLTRWRLKLAAETLVTSNANVVEIAAEVGYASEAAFNRVFKREVGCPPAQFRRYRTPSQTK